MTPLLEAFPDTHYDLLGQMTCLGTKTYLEFDKNQGWSLTQLNIIQRIFRWIFGSYRFTHLDRIYCAVSSELRRNGQNKEDIERIEKLRTYLLVKWPYRDRVPTHWGIAFYPQYARIWNSHCPGSFPEYVSKS